MEDKIMMINENTKVKLGYLGTIEGKSMYEMARNNPDMIISLFENTEADESKFFDLGKEFFKVNRDVKSFYIFNRNNGIEVFTELPLVTNTELFRWTYREAGSYAKSKMLWTQLSKGKLRFNCSYHLNTKNTHIVVMYEKAILQHLWVNNGDNEDILNTISEYIAEFEGVICYSVDAAELVNTNRNTTEY
jgi:hypothetical protein